MTIHLPIIINNIVVERSHRHVHLSRRTAWTLFGDREPKLRALSVLGEYATDLEVSVAGLGKCKALWPWREYDQLEVSMSEYVKLFDCYTPRRVSGDVHAAREVLIATPRNAVEIPVIVPKAHVHAPRSACWRQLFPWALEFKQHETVDGRAFAHLDSDSFNALVGAAFA